MNPKILPAAVMSAALALGGCASLNPLTESSTPFDCRSNTCEVPVEYNNIGSIIAHDIQVNADPGTNVQITFVLNSWMHAHFPPDGITVSSNFRCALDGTADQPHRVQRHGSPAGHALQVRRAAQCRHRDALATRSLHPQLICERPASVGRPERTRSRSAGRARSTGDRHDPQSLGRPRLGAPRRARVRDRNVFMRRFGAAVQPEFLPGQGHRRRQLQQRRRHHRRARHASGPAGIPSAQDPLGAPDGRVSSSRRSPTASRFTTPPLPPANEFHSANATAGGRKYNLTDANTASTPTDFKYNIQLLRADGSACAPQGSVHPERRQLARSRRAAHAWPPSSATILEEGSHRHDRVAPGECRSAALRCAECVCAQLARAPWRRAAQEMLRRQDRATFPVRVFWASAIPKKNAPRSQRRVATARPAATSMTLCPTGFEPVSIPIASASCSSARAWSPSPRSIATMARLSSAMPVLSRSPRSRVIASTCS